MTEEIEVPVVGLCAWFLVNEQRARDNLGRVCCDAVMAAVEALCGSEHTLPKGMSFIVLFLIPHLQSAQCLTELALDDCNTFFFCIELNQCLFSNLIMMTELFHR